MTKSQIKYFSNEFFRIRHFFQHDKNKDPVIEDVALKFKSELSCHAFNDLKNHSEKLTASFINFLQKNHPSSKTQNFELSDLKLLDTVENNKKHYFYEFINFISKQNPNQTTLSNTNADEQKTLSSSTLTSSEKIDYLDMTLKGSYRLGLQLSLLKITLNFIATLGLYVKFWYDRVTFECVHHLDEPQSFEYDRYKWLILVPGIHIFKFYRLSKTILQMEIRNGYKKTSPFIVFFLSIFPLFGMLYIQNSVNLHWKHHIKNYLKELEQTI